jgi:hypothetical protein
VSQPTPKIPNCARELPPIGISRNTATDVRGQEASIVPRGPVHITSLNLRGSHVGI